ncbi:AbrB/MazE/SpoVT family DNA-binding domain-containing protein [Rhodothermus marinus]|jgi:AbrB family looped-hinge helix DNA binding protein|uniref:AbrB/MazE/SpoVT family DNA-binding domain-containing protein n=1 Tax=Rhodothermus marinus TaxID=29549 RepID=UPI001DBA8512|nr:AbrB/MazE/SpoVT family DNA-binding domain-containing protein [Rhodothermus marinus]MBO2490941.1 AbrB/MazE/SpoVT family DNA-binding domain-containing protein [Rhodothermus marinus]
MGETLASREIRLGKRGQIVIPAAVRQQLGLSPGDRLIVRVEEGRLILEKRQEVIERVKARFAHILPEVCLSDELIAERRIEAQRS